MINLELIRKNVEEIVVECGYCLTMCDLVKEDGELYLRIEVEADRPLTMDNIIEITNKISKRIDEVDDSDESYILDISSGGSDKPIEMSKLPCYIGQKLDITTKEPVKGVTNFTATINNVGESEIDVTFFIKGAKKNVKVDMDNIEEIKVAI